MTSWKLGFLLHEGERILRMHSEESCQEARVNKHAEKCFRKCHKRGWPTLFRCWLKKTCTFSHRIS